MDIKILAAKSDNNVIGKDNTLVWDLPADYAFFTQKISTGLLLTGRKSFESPMGEDVFKENPRVIVVSRRKDYKVPPAVVKNSIEQAIAYAKTTKYDLLWILGGTSVYEASMDLASEIVMTEIHEEFEGDSFFPEIDPKIWEEVEREDHSKDDQNPHDYSFVIYKRRS